MLFTTFLFERRDQHASSFLITSSLFTTFSPRFPGETQLSDYDQRESYALAVFSVIVLIIHNYCSFSFILSVKYVAVLVVCSSYLH